VPHRSNGNKHTIETNMLWQHRDLGGPEDEQKVSSDEEVDWGCPKVIKDSGYNGNGNRMDGARSGTRCNLKQVKMGPLHS